jgi:hypothetical protein
VEKIKKIVFSDTCLIFALKNLDPKNWRDRRELQQDITIDKPIIVDDIQEDDEDETLLDQIISLGAKECLNNVNQFFSPKYFELNKRIVEVIENFNLVQYIPLNI